MKKRMALFWNQRSLKSKLYMIIISVGALMIFGILFNVRVVYSFIDDVKLLMDDNLLSYRFQEALGREVDIFSDFARNRTADSKSALYSAAAETERILKQLPYDYQQVGESRYAITWNIRNSYEEYQQQRERIVEMKGDEAGYITELYKVYRRQEYLKQYGARLMKEVLDGGNSTYEGRISVLKKMPYIICVCCLLALLFLFFLSEMLTRDIVGVLSNLVTASKSIEKNDFTIQDVAWEGQDEFGQLVHAFNKMKHATKSYVHTIEEKRAMEELIYQQDLEKANLEQRFAEAQLQLIKSQLNPHFLFNTLNMITRMTQIEEAPISQEMLEALSNLLRYSLRTTAAFIPLNQELKVIEDYMYIQKKRFGDRISWEIDCQVSDNTIEVPVFFLQPLVENAVIHGISMKEDGGNIRVSIVQDGDGLCIQVEDNGMGIKSERLEEIRGVIKKRGSGIGIGLGNIYRRIAAYYEQGDVTINSREGHGTSVIIILGKQKFKKETTIEAEV